MNQSHPNNCHPEQEQDQPRPTFPNISSSHISVNEDEEDCAKDKANNIREISKSIVSQEDNSDQRASTKKLPSIKTNEAPTTPRQLDKLTQKVNQSS